MINMDDVFQHIDLNDTIKKFGEIKSGKSRVLLTCRICTTQRETSVRCVKLAVKKFGDCLCSKCRSASEEIISNRSRNMKKLWEDDKYRANIINSEKRVWDEERRNTQSIASRQLWENDRYKEKIINTALRMHKEKDYSSKYSLAMQQLWDDPQYSSKMKKLSKLSWDEERRSKQSNIMINRWRSEFGDHLRGILKGDNSRDHKRSITYLLWNDPEYRQTQSEAIKRLWANPEYKLKKVESARRQWQNNEFRDQFAKVRSQFLLSGKRSSIEIITKKLLDIMNVNSVEQRNIGPYVFDFYIPSFDVYIECQGEYWHSLPNAKRNDAAKFSYLEKSCPSSRIIYLHERDFLNPFIVKQKIMNELYGRGEEKLVDFNFNDIKIKITNINKSCEFLNSFHYAQYGRAAKIIFGAYACDELLAICKFSTPVRKEVATSISKKFSEVLELDRFCIHPRRHKKNFASWFVSRCSDMVFESFNKISTLVSFADLTYGHTGSIYRSSNWKQICTIAPDYYYIDKNGWMMHKKTLYTHAVKMGKKEREYAEEFGYTKVLGKEKIKFVLYKTV